MLPVVLKHRGINWVTHVYKEYTTAVLKLVRAVVACSCCGFYPSQPTAVEMALPIPSYHHTTTETICRKLTQTQLLPSKVFTFTPLAAKFLQSRSYHRQYPLFSVVVQCDLFWEFVFTQADLYLSLITVFTIEYFDKSRCQILR